MATKKVNRSGGKAWATSVSRVEKTDVVIRGYSLLELMGNVPFSAVTYLLVRGEVPTPPQARIVDTILCSILDYALEKSGNVAARFNVSANPQMVAGIATAVLGVGEHTIAPEGAGRFIADTYAQFKSSGKSMESFARSMGKDLYARRVRVPGFGHPKFPDLDPRAQRLRDIAEEEGQWGDICVWYDALHRAYLEARGKPGVCINLVGMIACVTAELGFTPEEMTGLAVISTFPGVVAQISEELASGAKIRGLPDKDIDFRIKKRKLGPALKAAGWI